PSLPKDRPTTLSYHRSSRGTSHLQVHISLGSTPNQKNIALPPLVSQAARHQVQALVVEPTPLRVFYPAALLCLLSNFCRVSHLERFVMALFNDALKGLGVTALVGIGVVLAAPLLFPATAPALRPLAK